MPKVIKKRIPKTEIEVAEISEIQSIFSKVFEERRKAVLSAVGIIVAVAVVGTAWTLLRFNQTEKAAELEGTAITTYYAAETTPEEERETAYRKALDGFSAAAAVSETPTTMFYLAESHLKLGETDEAIKAFGDFLDTFPNTPLAPAVAARLAQLHHAAKRTDDALGSLQPVKNAVVGGDTALSDMARILESEGRSEEALGLLKTIVASHPDSPWAAEARAKVEPPETESATATEAAEGSGSSVGEPATEPAEKTAENNTSGTE